MSETLPGGYTLIRIGSHRAGKRLKRALGHPLDAWTELTRGDRMGVGGVLVLVRDDELDRARAIPSITRFRIHPDSSLMPCWPHHDDVRCPTCGHYTQRHHDQQGTCWHPDCRKSTR